MRDFLVLILLALIAGLAGAGVYFYSERAPASAPAAVTGTPVTYTELAHGRGSTVLTRKNFVIHSAIELNQLWKMTDAKDSAPEVDFSANDVIAVFAGEEPTAGYTISVSQITDTASARNVEVTISSPGGSCVLAQQLTAPYQIIEVPKTTLSLTHTDTQATESCLD